MKRICSALSLALVAFACARHVEEPRVEHKPASRAATPPPALPPVFAIGDLHGDLAATRRALQLTGTVDANDRWIGGRAIVVQTGDVIDRGDDDRAVLELLEGLREQARESGGAFIPLTGNHEIMNVAHDFRYVTAGAFASFGGEEGRGEAFRPGAAFARMLAHWPITTQVGDTVFVHGGVLEKHARYGLARINHEVSAYLRGERPAPPDIVIANDGPIWTRLYSGEPDAAACAELGRALALLDARRLVVGHTPQPQGINAACEGRVWRIDVGMSRAYGGVPQVLEIADGEVRVRSASAPPSP